MSQEYIYHNVKYLKEETKLYTQCDLFCCFKMYINSDKAMEENISKYTTIVYLSVMG